MKYVIMTQNEYVCLSNAFFKPAYWGKLNEGINSLK